MAVSFGLLVTCWKRADLLALLYVMFSCVTFPYGVLWSGVVLDCIDIFYMLMLSSE